MFMDWENNIVNIVTYLFFQRRFYELFCCFLEILEDWTWKVGNYNYDMLSFLFLPHFLVFFFCCFPIFLDFLPSLSFLIQMRANSLGLGGGTRSWWLEGLVERHRSGWVPEYRVQGPVQAYVWPSCDGARFWGAKYMISWTLLSPAGLLSHVQRRGIGQKSWELGSFGSKGYDSS